MITTAVEEHVNKHIEKYISDMKQSIQSQILELSFEETDKVKELLEYIYGYERLVLKKEDFRLKPLPPPPAPIPIEQRCIGLRANKEQCIRRKKKGIEFCGVHEKCTPYGIIKPNESTVPSKQKIELIAEEIRGIVYYMDKDWNVYNTEDIIRNIENPRIIGHAIKYGDEFSIPSLGI